MIVGILTTCHTQYTSDSNICIFLFHITTLQVFVTYLTGALYVHPLWFYKHQHDDRVHSKLFVACQRWWFQWRFWFVPSVPGYLREEGEHKPDPWRNPIERNHMELRLENEVAVVKTPTIISNNPVQYIRISLHPKTKHYIKLVMSFSFIFPLTTKHFMLYISALCSESHRVRQLLLFTFPSSYMEGIFLTNLTVSYGLVQWCGMLKVERLHITQSGQT